MGAATKWPGGALARAIRAGMEFEGSPEVHPECHSTHRRMQVGRLMRRHRVSHQRALVLAVFAYGVEMRSQRVIVSEFVTAGVCDNDGAVGQSQGRAHLVQ